MSSGNSRFEKIFAGKMVVESDSPHTGKLKAVGNPIRMSGVDAPVYGSLSILGEHSEAVLSSVLGYRKKRVTT
jgi:crotonobetainyl-CoA:carnitine CoA-transferase CaiB-like acyl-CoA transferase